MLPQPCHLYIWIFCDGDGTDGWKCCFRITFSCKLRPVLALRGEKKVPVEMRSTNCQPPAIRRFPRSFFRLPRSRKMTVGKVDFQLLSLSAVSLVMVHTSESSGPYDSQRHKRVFRLSSSLLRCFKAAPVSLAASSRTRGERTGRFCKYAGGKYHETSVSQNSSVPARSVCGLTNPGMFPVFTKWLYKV